MSNLKIKYNRATGIFEFDASDLDSRYCDVVACLDTDGETLEFSDLKYGVILKNGETAIGEKTYPPEDVKIRRSNQSSLSTYRVQWESDMVIDIEVWMRQTFGEITESYQLTVPRPLQPYPSWIWSDILKDWESPTPCPDDDNFYNWDEETLSWIVVE